MKIIYIATYFISLLAEFYFLILLKEVSDIPKLTRRILIAACVINGIFPLFFVYAAMDMSITGTIYSYLYPNIYLLSLCLSTIAITGSWKKHK